MHGIKKGEFLVLMLELGTTMTCLAGDQGQTKKKNPFT